MGETRRLSVGQEALWFLYRLAPDSAAYNVSLAVRVLGAVDAGRLAEALEAVVARHDVLSSVFFEVDGKPVRAVLPADTVPLTVREIPEADEEALPELAARECAAPFRLRTDGAFRAVLLRRTPEDAVLVLVAHHIATDATAQWLILRDLLAAYEARSLGTAPDWPPLRLRYDEHVEAERALLATDADRLERFWLGACAGSEPAVLPTDRPRAGQPVPSGATRELRFADGLGTRLRAAAATHKVSPFAYLLGAFQGLLYRFSGQDDFVIGCPTTTRIRPGTRDLVGYLVNTMVLRATFDPATTFADTAVAAQRRIVRGMAHLGYPFALLARSRDLGRAEHRFAAYRIAFTMIAVDRLDPPLPMVPEGRWAGDEIDYRGLRIALLDLPQQEGQSDLSVEMRLGTDSLGGVFRYRANLFEAATIDQLADHFGTVLEAAVCTPDLPVAQVSLVDGAELARLLSFGAGTLP
jgi:hypothetical protein